MMINDRIAKSTQSVDFKIRMLIFLLVNRRVKYRI